MKKEIFSRGRTFLEPIVRSLIFDNENRKHSNKYPSARPCCESRLVSHRINCARKIIFAARYRLFLSVFVGTEFMKSHRNPRRSVSSCFEILSFFPNKTTIRRVFRGDIDLQALLFISRSKKKEEWDNNFSIEGSIWSSRCALIRNTRRNSHSSRGTPWKPNSLLERERERGSFLRFSPALERTSII